MTGNLILSITKAFHSMFGVKNDQQGFCPPYYSAESLGYANHKLGRGICPQCDRVTSMAHEAHDNGTTTTTCGKCGAQYLMDERKQLVALKGYHPGIHERYLRDIAAEVASIHWQATYQLEVQARKAA